MGEQERKIRYDYKNLGKKIKAYKYLFSRGDRTPFFKKFCTFIYECIS